MARAVEGAAATALRVVFERIEQAAQQAGRCSSQVRLVAVSKTKPVSVIKEVYEAGHRYFGENYVQELIDKAPQVSSPLVEMKLFSISCSSREMSLNGTTNASHCTARDIKWHYIGHLQSNKAKNLVANVPNLYMVEGVDSTKVANYLDRAVAGLERKPLKVLVQVNTSGEESKSGVEPSECVELARHALANCREGNLQALDNSEEGCELSMGMSSDFELAVQMGSTNIRVGSTIFGVREYPAKQQ
ncbi:hypothetical protein O6H91_Y467200 [Diphasiastrum complanatum]|nr:hypothetical protein O6H91_Y467200 [Diphasiastrum complanatum]